MTAMPDARGRFGDFGGRFVPETVMGALDELAAGYEAARADPAFAGRRRAARPRLRRPAVARSTSPSGWARSRARASG